MLTFILSPHIEIYIRVTPSETLIYLLICLNRHIGFNVIFAAVYYDVLLVCHDVIILLVYM